jgi:DHA3 family macrolide efflux protein-like MFS transporter
METASTTKPNRPTGLLAFTIVWVGQTISLLGTEMTGFALSFWAFNLAPEGFRATAFAIMNVCHMVPLLVMSPFAGAIVDRSNRKLMMIIPDLASGLTTIAILLLYATGHLQIWHLFITTAIEGTFQTFQWPAYSSAITLMVDKKHYARTSAMNELAGNTSGIFAPMLASALISVFVPNGVVIIMLIDVVTFVAAIGAVLMVHIPQPEATEEGRKGQGNIFREAAYGFQYIFQRPSLLGLQLTFLGGNFFSNLAFTVFVPMILARTNQNALVFGSLNTAGAIGGLVGGLLISAWGGPKRRVYGVVGGWVLSGILGTLLLGLGRGFPAWVVGIFLSAFVIPLVNSSNQAIWQAKVAADVQGRVFATRRLIAWFATPLAAAIAGPLADRVLEPGMRPAGSLAGTFGWLVGTGPGTGMSLLFIFAGIAIVVVSAVAFSFPAIRNVEDILPDHDMIAKAEPQAETVDPTVRMQELLEARQRLLTDPALPDREDALNQIEHELSEIQKQRRSTG